MRAIYCYLLLLHDELASATMVVGSVTVSVACVVVIVCEGMIVCAEMHAPVGMNLVGMALVWAYMRLEMVGIVVVGVVMSAFEVVASVCVHSRSGYWSWGCIAWWGYMMVVGVG
jgi:hypothetical protein